jgi:hypothetical protein
MMNYTQLIADLARRYTWAKSDNAVMRDSGTQREEVLAYARLCWMIDAEKFGWNPEDMEECVAGRF